jgi:hypothetical protein
VQDVADIALAQERAVDSGVDEQVVPLPVIQLETEQEILVVVGKFVFFLSVSSKKS